MVCRLRLTYSRQTVLRLAGGCLVRRKNGIQCLSAYNLFDNRRPQCEFGRVGRSLRSGGWPLLFFNNYIDIAFIPPCSTPPAFALESRQSLLHLVWLLKPGNLSLSVRGSTGGACRGGVYPRPHNLPQRSQPLVGGDKPLPYMVWSFSGMRLAIFRIKF